MKRKIFSVLFALVLICSLGLVMAAPVAADPITGMELTVTPNITGAEAYYKVVFQVHNGLQGGTDTISVRFPDGTTVPAALGTFTNKIKLSTDTTKALVEADTGTDPSAVTVTGQQVMMWLPAAMDIPAENWVMVEFGGGTPLQGNPTVSAGIINHGTAGTYSLCAWTCEEPTEVCVTYGITIPPGPVDVYLQYAYSEVEDDICCLYRDYYMGSFATITLALAYADTDLYAESEYDCTPCGGEPSCPTEGVFYGAKLVVHDGTYPENIEISTPCVTVESINGPAVTTIDASSKTAASAVVIESSDVTLGGDGVGFTIIAPDGGVAKANKYGVFVGPTPNTESDIDCVTIEGNTIKGSTNANSNSPQVAIYIWPCYTAHNDDITIKNNSLTTTYVTDFPNNETCGGVVLYDAGKRLSLEGNTIDGFSVGVNFWNWDNFWLVAGTAEDQCVIKDNIVKNNKYNGIEVSGDYFEISENQIFDNAGNGLRIQNTALASVGVFKNSIHGNGNGVKISEDATKVTVRYNDIYSNTNTSAVLGAPGPTTAYENYGVKNLDTAHTLDAKENYWGELGGPSCGPAPCVCPPGVPQQSLALGNGDAVSHYVYYNPWLSVSYVTVIAGGIRYYGSDTLTLQAGWNTLSVPLELYDYADTIAEIEDMGNFLTSVNYADLIYEYNADPTIGAIGFVTPTTLVPCRGYYIKMNAPSKFPVLYYNSLGLPALELSAGWNLIGAAFGIDKDDDSTCTTDQGRWAVAPPALANPDRDPEAEMGLGAALNSIGGQASVVVSPSTPGQLAIWAIVYDSTDTTTLMYTGEAYWVFMTSSGTLAGWEITPFYFTPVMP